MKTPILISLFLSSLMLSAQPVSFTNQGNLLGPINGFNYNDCAVDMNGDFLDDVVRVSTNRIYIDYQQSDGTFQQNSFILNLTNEPDWSICAGDLDDNGYNDLLFGGGNAVSFVMSNDSGTVYTEYPHPEFIFSQRSTMADIDNDGDLDAFVCHDVDKSHPYRNDGSGIMTLDQSLIETYDRPGNYAAIWTDYDNDNDIDLYITKCKGGAAPGDIDRTNLLYQNNGDGSFSEVADIAGVADNAQSWSTVFEDFDNDGDFDAFIVNHDFKNRFYLNNGDGTFTDIIDSTGINPNDLGAWENAAGDFNNDGYVDIFSELNKQLYLNNGDLTFTGQFAPVTPGGIGDFNNDGFLDVIKGSSLYINDGNDNNWLKVNTVGFDSNLNGIGARIEIYGEWGRQIREIRSGQSFAPMSSLQAHFGLGQADSIEKVVVRWPSGVITTIEDPEVNTTITVQEAGCLLPPTNLTASGSTDICPGTSVDLTAPDGFATYSWSTGDTTETITITEAGIYRVISADTAGCISVSEDVVVSIIEDIPPVIEVQGEDYFCEGGSTTLTISEGNNPLWSNGDTGMSTVITSTGEFTVSVDAQCSVDQMTSEAVLITELASPAPMVTDVNIIQGQTADIEATGDSLHWYDMPTGGTLLGIGNTFTTNPLDETTTYYVESHNLYPGEKQNGGKPDNSGGGGVGSLGYLVFDVWEPFTLNSVRVYSTSQVQSVISLYDGAGNIIQQLPIDVPAGENVVDLNFAVPVGTGLSIRNSTTNLYRNNGGVNYPYLIGEMGEITGSSFGGQWYYHFYDWKVQKQDVDCVSDRVEVTVEVTDAEEAFKNAGFRIFPNPTSDNLFVKMESGAEKITILDAHGRLVFEKETQGFATDNLKIQNLTAGIYLIRINADGKLYHTKFIKE